MGWSLAASHFQTGGYLRNNYSNRNNFSVDFFFDLPFAIQTGAGIDYSDTETGFAVYNRPDSPYYKSGEPAADEKASGGPGISSRLLEGQMTWGDDTKTEDENLALSAFAEKKFSSGRFRTDFRLWNQDRREVYYAADDRDKKIYERTTVGEDNNWLWQAEGTLQFGKHHLAAGGQMKHYGWGEQNVDYIDQSYFNSSINSPFFAFVKEGFKGQPDLLSYYALYLQDEWHFHPKLCLEAGVRSEWFHADSVDPDAFGYEWETAVREMDENHLDPRVALVAHPIKNSRVTAGIGMVHRYPTSPEYFWWYLNNSTDFFNTDLHAEEALQYELGIEQNLANRLTLRLRGYYYDIKDYIEGTSVPRIGQVKYNIGEVDIKGIEVSLSADLPHGVQPWANTTWQEGEKDDDPWDTDNHLTGILPDLPDVMVNAGVNYKYHDKAILRLWLNHVGERQHLRGDAVETLNAYTLFNFSATCRVWQTPRTHWELLLSGENIFDESYQQEEGYPMTGALFMAGLRLIL
ncbi:MAG: TonB-dependent receptor, partial [Desulfatitalea sp.]|nr:TonB-dependent receptor [Desulfatitalea sp.]NNK01549.1 TonB-dependent receptor [Desulfatitalea sp.]